MYWHSKFHLDSKAPLIITCLHLVVTQIINFLFNSLRILNLKTVLYWILFIGTLICYYRTAYANPGYIEPQIEEITPKKPESSVTKPKISHEKYVSTENDDNQHEIPVEDSKDCKDFDIIEANPGKSNKTKEKEDTKEEILEVETRYCTICIIEQPIRAKHCRECGKCVALHDHHCPWLGICIGEKNRFYFWWYLFFECILLWSSNLIIILSLTHGTGWEWVLENLARVLVMIVISFFIIMVSLLLGYHTYLMLTNQTTWENISWEKISYLKDSPRKYGSPFSKGVFSNLWFYCCQKFPRAHTVWVVIKKGPQNSN